MLEILFLPFIACVILTGIHAYLGLHIIERGVIFVDLSLAQIAALGALTGFLFGIELHTTGSYFFSLGFTFLGAILFSTSRSMNKKIPMEAVIGIIYVVAAAVSVLILSKTPSEAEHIKTMLVGNILFIKTNEVIKIAIFYSAIGAFHYIFRNQFISITGNQNQKIKNIPLWDFLFYATFGAVVTSSVEIAGVLLVFSYLIIPAASAFIIFNSLKSRLYFSWGLGIVGSIGGMILSVFGDLPTGASIVAVFGLIFMLFLIYGWIIKKVD